MVKFRLLEKNTFKGQFHHLPMWEFLLISEQPTNALIVQTNGVCVLLASVEINANNRSHLLIGDLHEHAVAKRLHATDELDPIRWTV